MHIHGSHDAGYDNTFPRCKLALIILQAFFCHYGKLKRSEYSRNTEPENQVHAQHLTLRQIQFDKDESGNHQRISITQYAQHSGKDDRESIIPARVLAVGCEPFDAVLHPECVDGFAAGGCDNHEA